MAPAPAIEQKSYEAPKSLHGFELVRDEFVAEYDSRVLTYKHQKTGERDAVNGACARANGSVILQVRQQLNETDRAGCQVMSLVNSDENKTFGVVLRTPVENSKGIPHILEHSVLCGSRKYPIKEPFVELMKVRQQKQLV